ncbi:MAG TPA: CoA transferase [Alphaproteobacteria bacterium]|jgi:crotonobetainyl-CoA:carnitine CoA-transferase CaiB-like acyl-CoA transferase|nr:CoA transferase [Alphaproteobacteria bacterium]
MSGLKGLTVLEIADTLGAAFAGSLLADYNATVIVCEPPEGSKLRRLGPTALDDTRWKVLARNKQSVAADWSANATKIRELLAQADMVIVDTAAPQRAGNPWFAVLETMQEAERPLVVEVFPTGADRPDLWPYASRAEFAGAASGVMALTGHTGKTPIQAEAPLTDYLAGTLAATRALIELRAARLTAARPATVSVPLHKAVQRMIEWQTPVATAKGRAETRMANNFPMNAGIANMHPTGDGKYVAISAVTQATAMRLMNMVGGPELCTDPRYATPEARSTGLSELYARIDAWTGARTTAEILETAAAQDVVLGPIYTTDDILADEQVAARGNVIEVDSVAMPSVTPRLSGLGAEIRNLGPAVGADNDLLASFPRRRESIVGHRDGGEMDSRLRGNDEPLKVLELGAVIAGPFAGSLMAELGGDVVKIETPGAGDSLRGMGPAKDGWPLWFGASAREKSCVTLNLKHPEGKAMFLRLVAQADVLVENFRPGVLERLGLSWNDLRAVNPRLVMLSISGFGQTGPQTTRPGFGKIAEGLSGVVSLTGPGGQSPLFVGFSLADAAAGLFGIYGVAAALFRRDVLGGEGGRIDLALYEPLMRMLDCQLALHSDIGSPPARSGGNDPYSFGIVSAGRPGFRSVGSASGDWYLVADATGRLNDLIGEESLEDWGRRHSNAEIESALRELGLDFTLVFDGMSIARSPYFQARGDVVETEHHGIGRITAAGRVDGARPDPVYRPPGLGEDNEAVFGRLLGLDAMALERLAAEGVI